MVIKVVIYFKFFQHFCYCCEDKNDDFQAPPGHVEPETNISVFNHKMKLSLGLLSGQILYVLNFTL